MAEPNTAEIFVVQSIPVIGGAPPSIFRFSSNAAAGNTLVADPAAGSYAAAAVAIAGVGFQLGLDELGGVHKVLTTR